MAHFIHLNIQNKEYLINLDTVTQMHEHTDRAQGGRITVVQLVNGSSIDVPGLSPSDIMRLAPVKYGTAK